MMFSRIPQATVCFWRVPPRPRKSSSIVLPTKFCRIPRQEQCIKSAEFMLFVNPGIDHNVLRKRPDSRNSFQIAFMSNNAFRNAALEVNSYAGYSPRTEARQIQQHRPLGVSSHEQRSKACFMYCESPKFFRIAPFVFSSLPAMRAL